MRLTKKGEQVLAERKKRVPPPDYHRQIGGLSKADHQALMEIQDWEERMLAALDRSQARWLPANYGVVSDEVAPMPRYSARKADY